MPSTDPQKTVFISYRRSVGSEAARTVFLDLTSHSYDTFMDVESINAGRFDAIILRQIEARTHFVLILTPTTLERCAEPEDWLRREIEFAIEKKRNIVPLFFNSFQWNDDMKEYLTGDLVELPSFNGINVPHDYFDAAMGKLRRRFLKQHTFDVIKPKPTAKKVAEENINKKAARKTGSTLKEMLAELFVLQAFSRDTSDYKRQLTDYSRAIRLNPEDDIAYHNRGIIRAKQNDLSGAIADFNEAIRINPGKADLYFNRGLAHETQGYLSGAIADFEEAIRLDPKLDEGYLALGNALVKQDDLISAMTNYNIAVWLNPQSPSAYNDRGEAYFALEEFEKAHADFRQANILRPNYSMTIAGLAIACYGLDQNEEAMQLWNELMTRDTHYQDADWVGKELNWRPELVEAARKLIATL